MSGLDLTIDDIERKFERLTPVDTVAPGVFEGFARGAGMHAMRGFAKTAAAVDMVGAVGPIVQDAFTGGTTAQDRYFKEHDDLFGRAIEYWTPNPNEVGVAGQVMGELLHVLPTVMLSPSLAVGATQMGTAEELVKMGVDPPKAMGVGAIQGAGLGAGIWVPIYGRSLWERMLVGGAGFNVVQGAAMRGASGKILEDTPAAEMYKALDGAELTIDILLGLAFGGMAHLSPEARKQGAEGWERVRSWMRAHPEQQEALLAMRQAQHINVDTLPGKPVTEADQNAHVDRVRTALDQMVREEPINVAEVKVDTEDGAARDPQFEPLPERTAKAEARGIEFEREAAQVRDEEGIPPVREILPTEQRPIYRAIREGLEAAGRFGPEEHGAYAKTTQAFYEAMAARMGMTPEELFAQYPLRITKDAPGAQALEQRDPAAMERLERHLAALETSVDALNGQMALSHPKVRTQLVHNPDGSLTLDGIEMVREADEGKGHGPKAMRDIVDVADRTGKPIFLMAYPKRPKDMPLEKLVAWYRQFGFEPLPAHQQDYPGQAAYMYREPQGAQRETGQESGTAGLPRAGQVGDGSGAALPGVPAPGEAGPLFQSQVKAPRFYSELQRQLESIKQDAATAEQWKGTIKNLKGVKKDEIEWSGINDWLDIQPGRVTKQDVLAFLENNGVKVEEVLLGKDLGKVDNAIDRALAREGYTMEVDPVDPEQATFFNREGEIVDVEDLPASIQTEIDRAVTQTPELDTLTDRLSNLGWGFDIDNGRAIFEPLQAGHPLEGRSLEITEMTTFADVPPPVAHVARLIHEAATATEQPTLPTKFSQYQLPGGENYRELLLTLPTADKNPERLAKIEELNREMARGDISQATFVELSKQKELIQRSMREDPAFRSSHFDQPNVLAHVRFNDRVDSDGKKVLFIEEIQSDFAQQTRKARDNIREAVDKDFEGIVKRMEQAGLIKVECD